MLLSVDETSRGHIFAHKNAAVLSAVSTVSSRKHRAIARQISVFVHILKRMTLATLVAFHLLIIVVVEIHHRHSAA
jgi:hypothetical protein